MKIWKRKKIVITCLLLLSALIGLYAFTNMTEANNAEIAKQVEQKKAEKESPPVIKGLSRYELTVGEDFELRKLNLHAYDYKKNTLLVDVISSNVNPNTVGNYKVVVEAKSASGKTSRKHIDIIVKAKEEEQPQVEERAPEPVQPEPVKQIAPMQTALDRTNLYVRGWRIEAPDANVSDDTLRKYMQELSSLPIQYNTSHLHTITIDLSKPYPYLGMGYSDGRMWLNGQDYYRTTVLHEATHIYDFNKNLSQTAEFQNIFHSEKGSMPATYTSNMNDNAYEWLANAVVFYTYEPQTLANRAPLTFQFVNGTMFGN